MTYRIIIKLASSVHKLSKTVYSIKIIIKVASNLEIHNHKSQN